MGIGWGPEGGGAAAENLAGGEQMGMDLQPDDGFVLQCLPPECAQPFEGYLNSESLSRQGFQGFDR
jgi:hypothetical protein